ncbi:MAG: acyl-CoA dehydrogenase family protein [Deltaproteobacteria bacterium]|nr:acyl-CoA dehydrogenase family protein [Deltaproteobacteria bacterium]
MDFNFTPEEEKFRKEVRDFFIQEEKVVAEATKEWDSGLGYGPNCWKILKKIGSKGWLCPTWPKEYGGLELSYMYRYVLMEEMQYFLNIYSTVGAGMAGPVIMKHGSEEQKKAFLIPIARGEIEFALGYTEPQAGSDLAALAIKAEDKGDYFLMNGSKIFNTRAHYAQYHWLGARTEVTKPKYKGISLFVVDLKTPGITIRPIWTVGATRTNEVFYDNVQVPKTALVGEVNRGFYYILEALDYERISTVTGLERDFQEIVEYVKRIGKGRDPIIRQKLANLAIEINSAKLLALRVAWMLNKRQVPNYEAAMLKLLVSETEQRLVNTAMQIFGLYGQIQEGSRWAQLNGKYERIYRDSLESLITRGTSEIMRNVIAGRGLGLPRD